MLSTTGTGEFQARVDTAAQEITYSLSYAALEGNVLQAHIHLGGRAQSGGISVFLCTNLGNGPAGTQACPAAPATISGTIRPADVIGPAGQGITAGQFDELVAAMRADVDLRQRPQLAVPGRGDPGPARRPEPPALGRRRRQRSATPMTTPRAASTAYATS